MNINSNIIHFIINLMLLKSANINCEKVIQVKSTKLNILLAQNMMISNF